MEEEFEAAWEQWLRDDSEWNDFFDSVESAKLDNLAEALVEFGLVSQSDFQRLGSLHTSEEGRAVAIAEDFVGNPAQVSLLALGFAKGEPGSLAVPYMQAPNS